MSAYKNTFLNDILPLVQLPGQYVGNEVNVIRKDWEDDIVKFALAFPDLYTIGMSNLGIQILYDIANQRPDALCERFFAPDADLEKALRAHDVPLLSLEQFQPMKAFDLVGFSVQTELCYTNILTMLDLGGIPFKAAERDETMPLICAGGHNSNYEPVADMFDFILIGEGEEALPEILETLQVLQGASRAEKLDQLEKTEGVYIPSRFAVSYNSEGTIAAIEPTGERTCIQRRIVADLDNAPYPLKPLVPNIEVVHARINIELMRGCPNACRYCMSGNYTRRVRTRSSETVKTYAEEIYRNTGYDDISLLSLSTGDYPGIMELLPEISDLFEGKNVGISLPSLSVTPKVLDMLPQLKAVRRSGLTFAPETGNQELRRLLQKRTDDNEMFDVIREAFRKGWDHIKLYFMVGIPGETREDIDSILRFVEQVSDLRREIKGKPGRVNFSISPFVPKPFTPFQWEPMDDRKTLEDKVAAITRRTKKKYLRYKYPDIGMSVLEGVFSRGDRRLLDVIVSAWKAGARFDGWNEHFNETYWLDAFKEHDLDPDFYTVRKRNPDECLPWSHIRTDCETYIEEQRIAFDENRTRRKTDGNP